MRQTTIDHVERWVDAAMARYARDGNAHAARLTFDAAVAALRSLPATQGSPTDLARRRVMDLCCQYRAAVLAGGEDWAQPG